MEYVVVALRSRAQTVKIAEALRRYGIPSEIVSTPKEAGVGCGLSVKISTSSLDAVRRIIRAAAPSSFAGFFLVKGTASGRTVRSI